MKSFKLTPWRKTQIREKYRRKDAVIGKFSSEMEKMMRAAAEFIIDNAAHTGQFMAPNLGVMNDIADKFYVSVIENAYHTAKNEKTEGQNRKRLSKLPTGLPKNIKSLQQIFGGRKYFRSIMRRSKILTDRLRKQYLKKLKKQFEKVMPAVLSGELSPAEAKKEMMHVWDASKPRVETIFRTETTKYFADVQVNFFSGDSDIIGFLFDSLPDSSRTPICRSRHGLIYRPGTSELKHNTPPCHYNCRSHLIALANTPTNRKMIEEKDRDPANVKVVPLPGGWRS